MMDSQSFALLRDIVADALELPARDREAFVRSRASGDNAVLQACLGLLREHDPEDDPLSDALLARRRAALESSLDASEPTQPAEIANYRIIRCVGEGGMGIVYEAEQKHPKRRVAIKVVDSLRMVPELEQRLRLESEVQGRLQHPGIAQVFEAGVAHTGRSRRPYFAMEFIEGRPLGAFASDRDLSFRERLDLIARVADAIGYAHKRGVIHRDLKPDNVLVSDEGRPKILDFGIARLTGDATLAATAMTREGQILGTLAYMAPEQLTAGDTSIAPAADVYAMGVMLFELLTGRLPVELGGLSISAAVRQIDLAEPPKLRSIDAAIPKEVGIIVSTCLERDPDRRYADGAALASDIRRFLDDRAILASPPTPLYLTAKFTKRNRTAVIGASATVLTLLLGAAVALTLAIGQYQARLAAEQSDLEARRQQALLASQAFQAAADHAAEGRVIESIEVLESIPADLRGWGWQLLASSVPAWMPGDQDFGGLAVNRDAGTAWTGNRNFAVVESGHLVLTVIDGTLVTWEPLTGEATHRPELGTFSRVEQFRDVPPPNVRAYGPDDEILIVDSDTWSVALTQPIVQAAPATSRYEPSTRSWMWLEDSGHSGNAQADTPSAFIRTEAHGIRRIDLEADSDTDLPGWVDLRDPGDQAIVSLYRESEQTHWFRFAAIDTSSGAITARTENVPGSMSFVLLRDRDEIAAARMTYPDREPAGGVVVFDASTLDIKRRFEGIAQPLAYLPDRDRLVVRLEDGTYRLMDPDEGQLDEVLLLDHGSPFETVTPDGRTLPRNQPLIASNGVMHGGASIIAVTPRPYRPIVIDTTDPQVGLRPRFHSRPLDGALYHLAISPEGGLLAAMSPWQDEVAIIDSRNGETLALLPMASAQGHRWHAMLWFSSDGSELLATVHGQDKEVVGVTRWDLTDGTSHWTSPEEPTPLNSMVPRLDDHTLPAGELLSSRHAVTHDGNALLFTGSGENTIKRLDLASHTEEALPIGTAEGIAFSPDGRHLAAVATLGARIIDFETGEVIARPISDPDRLLCVAYSPDGTTLAVGSLDGRIFVIETEFYTLQYSFQSTPAEDGRGPLFVHDLRWSPDSRTLYAAHAGGVLTAWDTRHPGEHREQRAVWRRADWTAAELLDHSGSGGAARKSSTRLDDSSLSADERAALEIARVRAWTRGG